MANLIRTPKSGSDWTLNDLLAYNIRVVFQDSATFFGVQNLTLPQVDDSILNVREVADAQDDDTFEFLQTMEAAMNPEPNEESALDVFALILFRILRYANMGSRRFSRTRKNLHFMSCGEERIAKTDVCIMDICRIFLLVQEDKRRLGGPNPEPQLIAQAIAAFTMNNDTRVRLFMEDPLVSSIIPGITMMGTMPTFYKIEVTRDLVYAVQFGVYPEQETIVYAHQPKVLRTTNRYVEGMMPLDNRRITLSCYEAF